MEEVVGVQAKRVFDRDQHVWRVAQDLEASFLSEMLKSAGLDGGQRSFGGGAGESQFVSFMRDAQAKRIVESGGVGLAEIVYASMMEKIDET